MKKFKKQDDYTTKRRLVKSLLFVDFDILEFLERTLLIGEDDDVRVF
jgi:hypothetical protein